MTLTVIIRDEGPFIHLQDPCNYRSVHIPLTPEQESIICLSGEEEISQCFLEPDKVLPDIAETPKRYRVKSVEQMEKILGVKRGKAAHEWEWMWSENMWTICGGKVSPSTFLAPYRWAHKEGPYFLDEWVEEISE